MNPTVQKTIQSLEKIHNRLTKLSGQVNNWGKDTAKFNEAFVTLGVAIEKLKVDAADYVPRRGPKPVGTGYVPTEGSNVKYKDNVFTVRKVDGRTVVLEDSAGIISVAPVNKVLAA
jgi:hypothetical protein